MNLEKKDFNLQPEIEEFDEKLIGSLDPEVDFYIDLNKELKFSENLSQEFKDCLSFFENIDKEEIQNEIKELSNMINEAVEGIINGTLNMMNYFNWEKDVVLKILHIKNLIKIEIAKIQVGTDKRGDYVNAFFALQALGNVINIIGNDFDKIKTIIEKKYNYIRSYISELKDNDDIKAELDSLMNDINDA